MSKNRTKVERGKEAFEDRNRAFRILHKTFLEVEGANEEKLFSILCGNLLRLTEGRFAAFAIFNPRYQKSYAYHVLGVSTVAFYVMATTLKSSGSFTIMGIAIVGAFATGAFLFHHKVTRFF